jgi:protein-disulfide isomerase
VRFAAQTAREVEKKYVANGLVKIVFVDFILHGEPAAVTAAAAHCAQDQGQFWAYHDLLVDNFSGKAYTRKQLDGFTKRLKLDMIGFSQCLDRDKYQAFVINSTQDGRRKGVKIIPTLFINQRIIEGFLPFKDLEPIIKEELKKAS